MEEYKVFCVEIAYIQLDSIVISHSEAVFGQGKPRNSQHSGTLKKVSVAAWHQNRVICPVACLKDYISKTESLRGTRNASHPLIGSNKHHKPVSSSTVDRWIKDQLKETGVDTTIFSAHSRRGAAASKPASSGVNIQSILNQVHWAGETTFENSTDVKRISRISLDVPFSETMTPH